MTSVSDKLKHLAETEPFCPQCGAPEVDPDSDLLFVRGWKVHVNGQNHSHCLRCHVWFGEDQTVTEICRPDCRCHEVYPGTPTHYQTGAPL